MESADHIIDLGPKAGNDGGNIIAQGSCLLIASDKILEYDALSKSISEFDSSYNILSAPKAVKIE